MSIAAILAPQFQADALYIDFGRCKERAVLRIFFGGCPSPLATKSTVCTTSSTPPICYDCSYVSLSPPLVGSNPQLFRSRQDLLENLALRQQLSIFKRRNPRPTL